MTLELITIPCLTDNYAYLIHDPASGATAVVDVPEPAPILADVAARGWQLTDILLTHHHNDHIGGVEELRAATGARVRGARADARRLPPLDHALDAGAHFPFAGEAVHVLPADGHTLGHIAFHLPASELLFSGDSLMAAGCGRLFEGTAAQMWETLLRFAKLPSGTRVCSGHEYTLSNLRFALTLEPDNPDLISRIARVQALRAGGQPSLPCLLSEELATNPFLRAALPKIKSALGMAHATDAESFAEIRARKDRF